MDWNTLLAPVVIALVPILTMLVKKGIPDRFSFVIPLVATALGPLLDFVSLKATGVGHGPLYGIVYGMSGVALREVIDQLRKIQTGPVIGKP